MIIFLCVPVHCPGNGIGTRIRFPGHSGSAAVRLGLDGVPSFVAHPIAANRTFAKTSDGVSVCGTYSESQLVSLRPVGNKHRLNGRQQLTRVKKPPIRKGIDWAAEPLPIHFMFSRSDSRSSCCWLAGCHFSRFPDGRSCGRFRSGCHLFSGLIGGS